MQSLRLFFPILVMIVLIVMPAGRAISQSEVAEATAWFNVGVKEQNAAKRIEALSRAVQLDPNFVEALYQLGLAYKSQRDYKRAEEFLQKAYGAKSVGTSDELKQSILFELVTTYNKRGNIADYETSLRRIKKLATVTKVRAQVLYELGLLLHQTQRDQEALKELWEALQLNPSNREQMMNLVESIEFTSAGMTALKTRDWVRAILAFEKVLEIDPASTEARKRLKEAENGLDRENMETILSRYYDEGIAAKKRNDLGGAMSAFEKIQKLKPNYRDVARLLEEIKSALQKKTKASSLAPAANIDSLYQVGVDAFARKDWAQAVVALEEVQLVDPDYRDLANLLARARANWSMLKDAKDTVAATPPPRLEKSSLTVYPIFWIALAVSLMVLAGWLLISKSTRAWIHLSLGNYPRAARIYEVMLARNSTRLKIYPRLANMYLISGRRDEAAQKVYKIVLELNLAAHNRDEISRIVAQRYLNEGRTDSDAIEVLETALQAERRKQRLE
jgi:tetratricopeptide (TPR) repeat protein